jgi:multidrug efflux pump subunit AcrB
VIRRIVAAAIRNGHVTLVAFLAVVVAGAFAYRSLRRLEDAEIQPPYALLVTVFPGAGADRVERLVTRPMEEAVSAIGDIRWIRCTSRANVSVILLRLENGVDIDAHWQDLQERVAALRAELPEGVRAPEVMTRTFDDVAVATLALSCPGQTWADCERRLADTARDLKVRLERIRAVGRVETHGDRDEEIAVDLDIEALAVRRVTLERIFGALEARNVRIPPGSVERGASTVVIETTGTFRTLEEIGGTVIDVGPTGTPIRLRDVASIRRRFKDAEHRAYRDGSPALFLAVFPQQSADLVDLGDRLRAWVEARSPELPPGVRLEVATDQGKRIERRVGNFVRNLWQGMAIVVAVAFLLMGVRNALLVAVAVPASTLGALFTMQLLGIEIHQVSLGALVIALGMLVDNAVVVADNVTAHLRLGKSTFDAAVDGAAEVNVAVLSATLTTVAAFIPLMMMEGLTGEYVAALPLVVSAALVWSYLFALLIAPVISARVLRPKVGLAERVQRVIAGGFARVVPWVLRLRWLVVAGAVAAVLGALSLLGSFGVQFFPKAEMNQFLVSVEGPDGSTIARTEAAVRRVEARLRDDPIVTSITTSVGEGVPRFYYTHFPLEQDSTVAEILVDVRDGTSPAAVRDRVAAINREMVDLPDTRITATELELGPPVGAPVVVRLAGDDLESLRETGRRIRSLLLRDPDVSRAADDLGQDTRQVRAVVDDGQLALAGLSHHHVAATIRAAVEGVAATTFDTEDDEIDVTVRAAPAWRDDFSLLEELVLDSPIAGKVPLRQLARLEPVFDVGRLRRRNLQRTLTVSVWSDTLLATELQGRVERVLADVEIPPGVRVELGGEAEERDEAFANLGNAAALAALAVLVILVAQFRSYRQALVVLTTLPLTVVGAALGLWALDAPIGFMAMLGLVSLAGIVVNNAILLMEFVNIGRRRGLSVEEALVEAASSRLRPILTTTLTTVVGLIPLTFSGGGFWEPMGAVMMGGLLASTVLTLVVVPALARIVMGRGKPVAPPPPVPAEAAPPAAGPAADADDPPEDGAPT